MSFHMLCLFSRNNLFWHYQNICNICALEPQVYEEVQYRLRICVYNYIILLYKMIDTLKVLLIKSCGGLFIINMASGAEANITTPCEMEIFNFLWLIWDHYIPLAPT